MGRNLVINPYGWLIWKYNQSVFNHEKFITVFV